MMTYRKYELILVAPPECHLLGHYDVMLQLTLILTRVHQVHVDEYQCDTDQHSLVCVQWVEEQLVG